MTTETKTDEYDHGRRKPGGREIVLTIGALGVVYGDIGTSPLYAVRASVLASVVDMPLPAAVYASISLIIWALIVVVCGKYMRIIVRADNNGEGGTLAASALAHRSPGLSRRLKTAVMVAGGVGLALFYGEALLTPAISVLAAVDGLRVEQPSLAFLVMPISLAILVGLFALQRHGTARVGFLFGPIILIWFGTIGWLGLRSIIETPDILWALNPYHGISIFVSNPVLGFVVLGAVVLCVTGVEALYADLGHFGRRPIRLGWFCVAMPSLVLNYIGQGAAILRDPVNLDHPFYMMAPATMHYPLVLLAMLATIIASQAVISGAFSVTRQAVQLGRLPRMAIFHTSATEYGQIYVPRANLLMLLGVIVIVLIFRNADALAHAYGLAVTGQMVISTCLVAVVASQQWNWRRSSVLFVFGAFFAIDLAFFSSTTLKFFEGAWFPVLIAGTLLLIMNNWRAGRRVLLEKVYGAGLSMEQFLERADKTPLRVSGTAVFLTPRLDEVPGALLHNMKHNQVLHERVILLRADVADVPFVPESERLKVEKLGKGFFAVEVHFGFYEPQNIPRALARASAYGLAVDLETTTFFVRRETLLPSRRPVLGRWRTNLFIFLHGAAQDALQFFSLPPGRVVELGSQTEI